MFRSLPYYMCVMLFTWVMFRSLSYHVCVMLFTWVVSDFFEFAYHRLGHVDFRYSQTKPDHQE